MHRNLKLFCESQVSVVATIPIIKIIIAVQETESMQTILQRINCFRAPKTKPKKTFFRFWPKVLVFGLTLILYRLFSIPHISLCLCRTLDRGLAFIRSIVQFSVTFRNMMG